jgi:UDP-glucose 4-epimerase
LKQVIIIDNLSNSHKAVFQTIVDMVAQHYFAHGKSARCSSLRFHEADFTDQKAMAVILKTYEAPLGLDLKQAPSSSCRYGKSRITGVIHFAAYKAVGESIQKPIKYYQNNFCGLINFCSLLGDFGIKNLVFSSSATVYGAVADMGIPLKEEFCCQERTIYLDDVGVETQKEPGCSGLTNPYGRSKWMCEAFLNDLANADPHWNITSLRYFNPIGCDESGLIGEDPRALASNLMPVVLRVLTGDMPVLNIYGDDYDTVDGTAVRDYIHVTDLARGHLAALRSKGNGFRVYNLGSGRGYSVLDVIAAMENVSQMKVPTQIVGRRQGDVGSCVARVEKAQIELGWKTEKKLETCCRDIWWFLERAQ